MLHTDNNLQICMGWSCHHGAASFLLMFILPSVSSEKGYSMLLFLPVEITSQFSASCIFCGISLLSFFSFLWPLHCFAVANIETAAFNFPDAFKVSIPVRNNYMYARMKTNLPELYTFTACMWLKSKGAAGVGTPFSYSVPGQANELVLLESESSPLELIINDKVRKSKNLACVSRRQKYSCFFWWKLNKFLPMCKITHSG